MLDILDPTISTPREPIEYAARPTRLKGLRIGLLENTRRNSEAMLRRLARNLEVVHGMKLEAVVHKHQRAPLADDQLADMKGHVDFIVAGVGD